ncbi:MAG: sulfite exporter TauE/SafE family protein [Bacteroidetes bacterium]|nr:sulfite exporter TauE/SafE family protein [Bacteroidota bacterium]
MNITTILGLLLIGLASGLLSSMVGIGGGIVIVPALVFIFAMSQKMAQGTSLVMLLPPIGILAVINYYKAGYVDFKIAGILIISFIAGSYFGSKVALNLDESILKRIFGAFLMILAVKYLFFSK